MSNAPHVPVLKEETLALLQPEPGRRYIDGTFGFGGHSLELLAAGAEVIGFDLDDSAQRACRVLAADHERLHCHHGSFREPAPALAAAGWSSVDGVLLDLGVSSLQLDDPDKGFSYRTEGPLDLRFDQESGQPASALLAACDERELADIIWRLGEERGSRRIARAIVRARAEAPVDTTGRLREIVESVLPRGAKTMPVLSRVFQALRIHVNDELGALEQALAVLPDVLHAGGRAVIISYHSLEDRMVKRYFDREHRDCVCPTEVPVCICGHKRKFTRLTRRAVTAGEAEAAVNPRSRSARLRAVERV